MKKCFSTCSFSFIYSAEDDDLIVETCVERNALSFKPHILINISYKTMFIFSQIVKGVTNATVNGIRNNVKLVLLVAYPAKAQ